MQTQFTVFPVNSVCVLQHGLLCSYRLGRYYLPAKGFAGLQLLNVILLLPHADLVSVDRPWHAWTVCGML